MNHTQRVAYVARQRRSLTKALVRESVERYLEALAEEIASGGMGRYPLHRQDAGYLRGRDRLCYLDHAQRSTCSPSGENAAANENPAVRAVQATLSR